MNAEDIERDIAAGVKAARANVLLLTPCGVAGAEAMRERVRAEIPAAVNDIIRPLLALGMIEGWRNVCGVGLQMDPAGMVQGPFLRGNETTKKDQR